MKRQSLWRVSVITTPEAEDAVSELLGAMLGRPVSSWFDLETGASTVTVYLQQKFMNLGALASRRRVSSMPAGHRRSQEQIRKKILAGLKQIKNCGLKIGSGKVTLAKVRREDWAESWKRHFKPIEIGEALLIKPNWSRKLPRKNQAVVALDPGLGFGTGQHPTTAFCLRALTRHGQIGARGAFLDLGTGSGILAIAAAKLGFSLVHALDFDPEAIRVARANARANGVQNNVRIGQKDVTKLTVPPARRYDLICANLNSALLVSSRRRIVAQLNRGGTLVLAGMLRPEFSQVQKVFEALGLTLAARKIENEWCSGSFYYGKKNQKKIE